MIGGNSRNAGKTTVSCMIIEKLSLHYQVFGLKVTSIRKGEADHHGNHSDEDFSGFQISEELDRDSHKDTSRMLRAGAEKVFYICADEGFELNAIKEFLNRFNTNQPIICESRSLRDKVKPGIFMMMMRNPAIGKQKEVDKYLKAADFILNFAENHQGIEQSISKISFEKNKFITDTRLASFF